MTLETEHPDIYNELKQIRWKLENHFKDICDFEFTIQNGKLYILNVRRAKRTGYANFKSTIDFFLEEKIDLKEALMRICPTDVADFLKPTISNKDKLTLISRGLGGTPSVATGKIVFSTNDAISQSKTTSDLILVKIEISPEDIPGIKVTNGILTSRGGMMSHAMLLARSMSKCCVCGASQLLIDYQQELFTINGEIFSKEDWITIDGLSGNIYKGKAKVENKIWKLHYETKALLNMIDAGINLNNKFNEFLGKCWAIRDLLLHNISVQNHLLDQKQYISNTKYKSFSQPTQKQIETIRQKIYSLPNAARDNMSYIAKGFYDTLSRSLSRSVGIGNHYKYFHPLIDPMRAFISVTKESKKQLVAYEYYNINKYIDYYIDIYSIKIFQIIEIKNDQEQWFLDHTNVNGESLTARSWMLSGISIIVNDIQIKLEELPLFYSLFRKREYYWGWYEYNKTSYREMVEFLKEFNNNNIKNFRLNTYAHELGLMEDNKLTASGLTLID